jgi:hypothetical protein
MGEMACPQCGNPNLDVDAENNVVYCRNCGFAVQVDPETGDVKPLQEGGAKAQAPPVYRKKSVLGMDSFTFFMGATALLLLLVVLGLFKDLTYYLILQAAVTLVWWYNH